jgi:Flp pilus assembly protein TadD
MYRISLFHSPGFLFVFALVLAVVVNASGQNSLSGAQPRRSVSVLDSTKEQDGLLGSVRRVKTESARVELKDGQMIEGTLQLLELTTYALKGNRLENVSYPSVDPQIGKQEYKYDSRGNMTEMTLRDESGAILSREAYSYEFDNVGNWTKMVTSLVLFENGRLKREPIENTYRTITYYFDDNVAKIVDTPHPDVIQTILPTPPAARAPVQNNALTVKFPSRSYRMNSASASLGDAPPPLVARKIATFTEAQVVKVSSELSSKSQLESESNETPAPSEGSRFAARKANEGSINGAVSVTNVTNSNNIQAAAESPTVEANSSEADSVSNAAMKFYETGLIALENNDPKAASTAFLESVKLQPSASVYLNLGIAYLKIEKNVDAAKAMKESVKLNPNAAEAHYGFGLASFRLKRFPEAREGFKKAIQIDPKMAKAHYGLGLTYLELGQPDASTVEMRILESLDKKLAKQLAGTFPRTKDPCRFSMLCQ